MDRAVHLLTTATPLRNPVLITAVQGGGTLTPGIVAGLFERYEPEPIAEIDPDDFYDFTVVRPIARVVDGDRVIQWPQVRFLKVALDTRDLVIVFALEPNVAWRRMATAIHDVAEAFGIREVVQLSSFTGATPHTRPIPVQWLSVSRGVPDRFGRSARRPSYQGPATFSMVLGTVLRDHGLTVGTLNAIAPFYLGVEPNPHAVKALAEVLANEFDLRFDLEEVVRQVAEVERQAHAQQESSPHLRMFLANLEQQYDEMQGSEVATEGAGSATLVDSARTLPEAELVLKDVEALLRDHGGFGSMGMSGSPSG